MRAPMKHIDGTWSWGRCFWAALASLCFLEITPPALAGSTVGCDAYLRGDYAAAMREFRPLAARGDISAQIAVGWLYDNGLGIPHDDAQAVKWYRQAAEQGDARAEQYLATMYAAGTGVPKNLIDAEKWFRLAAEQGSSGGQYGLGVMYRDGVVVIQDPIEAYKWFSLASRSGVGTPEGAQAVAAQSALAASMTAEQIGKADELVKTWKASGPLKLAGMCER